MCAFKSGSRDPSLHLPLPNFEVLRCLWKRMDDVIRTWMVHQRAVSYVESTNIDHAEHEGMRRRSGPDLNDFGASKSVPLVFVVACWLLVRQGPRSDL